MKKEYLAIAIIGLFILGSVLDYVAGPVSISIRTPFAFLEQPIINNYPFTAVSIGIRAVALLLTIMLIFWFINKKYFMKGAVGLFLAALFELYSIQQLATASNLIPIQWTIGFAFAGILLIIPTILYFIFGIFALLFGKASSETALEEKGEE